jgi:hypothetical protein
MGRKSMPIQMDYSPDLDTPEVYAFLADAGRASYQGPLPTRSGYVASAVPIKSVGTVDQIAPGQPLTLVRAVKESYQVVEGASQTGPGTVIGSFDVVVPISQAIRMAVSASLLLTSTVTAQQRATIEGIFNQFTYPRDGDPGDFMAAQLAAHPGYSSRMFCVMQSYQLTKVGPSVEQDAERAALLAIYNGAAQGTVYQPQPPNQPLHGDPGYFARRGIKAVLLRRVDIGRPPSKPSDPHRTDGPEADVPAKAGTVANDEAQAAGCRDERWKMDHHKIMDLLNYPEFQVLWRDISIDVGCGVTIVLTVPELQTRTSTISLWAYVRYPRDLGALVERAIETCLWESALAGAVVGVALGNFAAALAAFRALIVACLSEKFGEFIDCMTPGILVNTDSSPWRDV